MSYQNREELFKKIADLEKEIEVNNNVIVELTEATLGLHSDHKDEMDDLKLQLNVESNLHDKSRGFVNDLTDIIKLYAKHSSPTIITERDLLDESGIPKA